MDSRKPILIKVQRKYIENNAEVTSSTDVDIHKIEVALLKFVDDIIKS